MWYRNETPNVIKVKYDKEYTIKPFQSIKVDDKYAGSTILKDITFDMEKRHVKPMVDNKEVADKKRKIRDEQQMSWMRGQDAVTNKDSIIG